MKKRIEALGYASLKQYHAAREAPPYSYELLRQVVYTGRVPKSETLLKILEGMTFPPSQVRKIMELHYRGYVADSGSRPVARPPDETSPRPDPGASEEQAGSDGSAAPTTLPKGTGAGSGPNAEFLLEDTEEVISRLFRALPKVPSAGNEDFWEVVRGIMQLAERKVHEVARRQAEQPLLFEKEPEAVYHFLVRKAKTPPYLSKGENIPLEFDDGIDYADRFRGALLGAAAGELLGRPGQGLSPRDIRELYGRLEDVRLPTTAGRGERSLEPSILVPLRALRKDGRPIPEEIANALAAGRGPFRTDAMAEFARNIRDRNYPWYEAGIAASDSAPAVLVPPLSLLRAGDFRRLKLEAGIFACVTHPHPSAVAAAIAQAVAVARLLHTHPGTLDVLGFARSLAPAIAGIEPERASRPRPGKPASTLFRKLGTELSALLLRRADAEEIRETLGNGQQALEGVPFAWACFLRSPDDFAGAIRSAANSGSDSEGTASMAGALCGAYLGASGIPARFLADIARRDEMNASADELLARARPVP